MKCKAVAAFGLILCLTIGIALPRSYSFIGNVQSNPSTDVFAILSEDPAQPDSSAVEAVKQGSAPGVIARQGLQVFVRESPSLISGSRRLYTLHSAFLI